MPAYVIAYDVGTTGIKTCLFEISDRITLMASAMKDYPIYVLGNGGVEQDPSHWWQAMCHTTAQILEKTSIPNHSIEGISFCAQMQSLVLVEKTASPSEGP